MLPKETEERLSTRLVAITRFPQYHRFRYKKTKYIFMLHCLVNLVQLYSLYDTHPAALLYTIYATSSRNTSTAVLALRH
jgi:hypothetical protein